MQDLVAHAISRLLWAQRSAGAGPTAELSAFDWPILRQVIKHARLFLVESSWFIEIYENAKANIQEPVKAQPKVEPPTVLPFECVFLTTEDAVLLFDVGEEECELVGFVLSLRGQFRAWIVLRDRKSEPIFLALYTSGQWQGSSNLSSLVVPQLATAINQQPAVVSPLSFAQRRLWQKQGKRLATHPEPFYRVRRPITTTAPAATSQGGTHDAVPRHAPTFRFDSRAHQRLLCLRGQLPLADADRATLEKRGYHVFLSTIPRGWTEAMVRRGHKAPMKGEWIAVRHIPVKQSIKGDPSLPYTPSLRTLR